MNEEKQRLREALDAFVFKMENRLYEKILEGFEGWDDVAWREGMENNLVTKANRVNWYSPDFKKNLIDIANLAMFLYTLKENNL